MDRDALKPAGLAARVIEKVMDKGSSKTGKDDSWKQATMNYHLDRAIRHAITYKLIAEGNQEPDGERHLELAMTRLAFALWKTMCN